MSPDYSVILAVFYGRLQFKHFAIYFDLTLDSICFFNTACHANFLVSNEGFPALLVQKERNSLTRTPTPETISKS